VVNSLRRTPTLRQRLDDDVEAEGAGRLDAEEEVYGHCDATSAEGADGAGRLMRSRFGGIACPAWA
jgi:hypothetical protein